MINLNRHLAEQWLNSLKKFWFNKDINSAVSLFKKTEFYQETPFMKPYTTLEELHLQVEIMYGQ